MEINLGDKTIQGEISRRHYVHYLPHTTEQDKTQFWTWLKYTFPRMDINKTQRVFGCNRHDLEKIQSEWGDKFYFEFS